MNRLILIIGFCCIFIALNAQNHISWVTDCANKSFCTNQGTCSQGYAILAASATTDCNFGTYLDYLLKVDLFNDGSTDIQIANDTIAQNFPLGTHKITWRVSDNCGSILTCSYLFTIKDCMPPNMICINGLTQSLDAPICQESFSAPQFILSLSDNCTPTNQIQIAMRKAGDGTGFPSTTTVSYGSCDVGTNIVEVWVKDGNGLTNHCQNYVLVQPSATGGCICNPDADVTLNTCVRTPNNKKISGYTVSSTLQSTAGVSTPINKIRQITATDSCTTFAYNKLPFGGSYQATLSGVTDGPALVGVTTYDLVIISKYILAVQPFQSVYQAIAADVNKSNSVTTGDVIEIRKLILGIYDTFPKVHSWRLIKPVANPGTLSGFSLASVKDTYNIALPNLLNDTILPGLDLIAIKYGDVNFSAISPAEGDATDRSPAALSFDNRWLAEGETVEVPVRLREGAELNGWQMALQVDPAYAQLVDIEGLPEENYSVTANGLARMLWYDGLPRAFKAGEVLFTLHLRILQPVRLDELLSLQSTILQPEGYLTEGAHLPFVLSPEVRNNPALPQFFPPLPNPFDRVTTFGIDLPEAGQVSLQVVDVSGKEVYQTVLEMEAGNQSIALPAAALPASGVYFYKMHSGGLEKSGRLVKY
jgi:hypothetical protein